MGRFIVEMDGAYFLSLLCAIFILGMFFTGRFFPPEETKTCELSQSLVSGQFTLSTIEDDIPPIVNPNNLIEEKRLEIIDTNI
jgi:hypothetical protein